MSGASGSGTGSDSISVKTTSREATPISDAESASSSMIAGQTNSSGFGGPLIHGIPNSGHGTPCWRCNNGSIR